MGLTTSGSIGAKTAKSLDDGVLEIQQIVDTSKNINKEVIVLNHGEPIANPEDAQYNFNHVNEVDGFNGASSMERFPTETAITGQIKKFKEISF